MTTASGHDRGLQVERTVLAWRRTALTAAAATGILVHHAIATPEFQGRDVLSVAGFALSTIVLAVLATRRWRELPDQAHAAAGRYIAIIAITIVGLSLAIGGESLVRFD